MIVLKLGSMFSARVAGSMCLVSLVSSAKTGPAVSKQAKSDRLTETGVFKEAAQGLSKPSNAKGSKLGFGSLIPSR
jgi:hypothetical protein